MQAEKRRTKRGMTGNRKGRARGQREREEVKRGDEQEEEEHGKEGAHLTQRLRCLQKIPASQVCSGQ
jgi:hypothetical protein